MIQRRALKPPGSKRKKYATPEQMRHLRDLAHRAGVETPRVTGRRETDEAIRRLEQHLAHMRQPTLEGM